MSPWIRGPEECSLGPPLPRVTFTELLMSELTPQCPLKVIQKVQSLENYSFINCDLRCFPGGLAVKICQCRRCRFDPWVGKIPWRKKWQPTAVFLPGKSQRTEEPGGLHSTGSPRVGHDLVTKQQQCHQEPHVPPQSPG